MFRCLSAAALLALPLTLAAGPADDVANLVRQLGSPRFADRQAASRALEEREDALDALRAAAVGDDPEIRRRAVLLLAEIEPRVVRKELRAVGTELGGLEMFVRRLVEEPGFATADRWQELEDAVAELRSAAGKVGGRPAPGTTIDWSKLADKDAAGTSLANGRFAIPDGTKTPLTITGSVVVCSGSIHGVTSLNDSVLIVRGEIGYITSGSNSVVICLGWLTRLSKVSQSSLFLPRGFTQGGYLTECFVEGPGLRGTVSNRNIFLNPGTVRFSRPAGDRTISEPGLTECLYATERADLGADFIEPKPGVAVVERIIPGTDLDRAGLQAGDELLEVKGAKVGGLDAVRGLFPVGYTTEPMAVRVRRNGREVSLTVAPPRLTVPTKLP